MSSRADFDKITNKHGKLIGVLNYNLMIPVQEKQLIRVNLKILQTNTPSERHYKDSCIDEINWCRKNASTIINKANCLYNLCSYESNYKGKSRYLNFKKLELVCTKYNTLPNKNST